MKKILISHPSGNSNTRGAVNGFYKQGMLHSFHTSVAVFKSSILYNLFDIPFLSNFKKRTFPDFLKPYTHTYPFKELGRILCDKFQIKFLLVRELGFFCTYRICSYIDASVAKYIQKQHKNIEAVYCYEDSAIQTFRIAQKNNIKCIYDLPIGYWRYMRVLLNEERIRNPEWAITLGSFNDSDDKLKIKDEELKLADKIYVASTFTKESLKLYPSKLAPIEVIPYGFPKANLNRKFDLSTDRKIKLLYVGGLSQRKGISYIFKALQGLEVFFELTIIGGGEIEKCPILAQNLKKHTYYPPLPHEEVLNIMAQNDILLFPSLFEGFGLVITEAMSQGTPVITTDRTCGPDIITNNKDGWIIKAGSAESIKEKLLYLHAHPKEIVSAGKQSLLTASKRPWNKYEEELATSVNLL